MKMVLLLTGTLTANINVIVPAEGRVYVVDNRCTGAFDVTFKTATGTGFAVPAADRTFLYSDGTDVFPVGTSGGGGGGAPTDASYLVSAAHSLLTGERVVTDTPTVTWDHATPGQSQANVPPASDLVAGVIELATAAEVATGTDAERALTPATLQGRFSTLTATETTPGLVELATDAETTAGTDTTRAVTPAGLAAKVPAGTPLSVARYAASGTQLEASTALIGMSGELSVNISGTATGLTVTNEHTANTGTTIFESYQPGSGGLSLFFRKALGTKAAPGRLTAVGATTMNFFGSVYARNAADTADGFQNLGNLRYQIESNDAQGRVGGALTVYTAGAGSQPITEALRVTQAHNLLLGTTTHGTSLSQGLVLGSGTAPTAAHPADAVQAWVADVQGVAGQAALHIRDEGGRLTTIGNGILSRQALTVVNAATVAAPYVLTVEESGKVLVSSNTSEMCQIDLPSAAGGYIYTFTNNLATGMRIRAAAGDWVRFGASQGATAGYIQTTTIGDTITLLAVNTIAWQMIGPAQGWIAGA